MDEPEPTNGPHAYEVPSSSTLPLPYKAVLSDCVETNDILQGKTHFNMGCHDNRVLCNPTARPTYDNISEHEYQEAEDVDLAGERSYSLLEVRGWLTIGHPCSHWPHAMHCMPLLQYVISIAW